MNYVNLYGQYAVLCKKLGVAACLLDFIIYVEIFLSRTNFWKRTESPSPVSKFHRFTNLKGILLNENHHWFYGIFEPEQHGCTIFTFDLAKEEFQGIPLPIFAGDHTNIYSFIDVGIVSGGCLCVSRFEGQSKELIQLWVMARKYIK